MTVYPAGSRAAGGRDPPWRQPAVCDAYDVLVSRSLQGSIFCRRWYLDAVAPGRWQLLTVGGHAAGSDGALDAAWPIVTNGRDPRHVIMPPMTQKLGMLLPPAEPADNYADQLASALSLIERLLDRLHAAVLNLASFSQSFHERFPSHRPLQQRGFGQTTRYTYLLHHLNDPDRLWHEMRPRARAAIRKARKTRLEVTSDVDFDTFLKLNDQTFRRQGLAPPVPHDLLRRLDEACRARGCRRIFVARDARGRMHAGVYIVWDNGTAYQLLLGSDPRLRRFGGPTLAIWHAIRFAASVAATYDFEGSMIPSVEAARRDLGARQTPYSLIFREAPSRETPLTATVRVLTRVLKRMPGR